MNLPVFKKFSDVISHIDDYYHFTPTPFKNGHKTNEASENQGSQKIFSFARLNNLSQEETLKLFCEHYETVLSEPNGSSHLNIREFIKTGWNGIEFNNGELALTPKPTISATQLAIRNTDLLHELFEKKR